MKWIQIPLGPLQTNCYVLSNQEKKCLIFDPGDQGVELNKYLKNEGYQPLAILLTHAHFDHIGGIDSVRTFWDIPVYVHDLEKDWLQNPSLNGSSLFGQDITAEPAEHLLESEGQLEIGPFKLELLHTPGHSPGSLSYYVKEENAVFAGDTLFFRSIGRTDLPGGSHSQLLASIKTKLMKLPENTVVLPGHGQVTSIQDERSNNPFLV